MRLLLTCQEGVKRCGNLTMPVECTTNRQLRSCVFICLSPAKSDCFRRSPLFHFVQWRTPRIQPQLGGSAASPPAASNPSSASAAIDPQETDLTDSQEDDDHTKSHLGLIMSRGPHELFCALSRFPNLSLCNTLGLAQSCAVYTTHHGSIQERQR